MLVRVISPSKGCVFDPGQLLRMGDKEAQKLIDDGFAERADESEVQKFEPSVNHIPVRRGGNPFMLPPRWIHSCGFVAKDEAGLREHAESCA